MKSWACFFEIVLRSSLQPYTIYFRIDDALRSVIFAELWLVYLCRYGKGKEGEEGEEGEEDGDDDCGGRRTAQLRLLGFLFVDTFG